MDDDELTDAPVDPPRRVGDVLDRVVRDLGAAGADAIAEAFGHWEVVAGPRLAPHARPVAITGGTLVVAVDDPLWATEIRYHQSEVLDRLAERIRRRVVTRLEVRIEPPG